MPNEKNKWTIERILFAATIAGWLISVGMGIQEFKGMRNTIDELRHQISEQQKQIFDQQALNGKILLWMELDSK